jgi:hypothetical protein
MINWIIQTDIHSDENNKLINSAKNIGHNVIEIDKDWCIWSNDIDPYTSYDSYIFRGSIEKAKEIWRSDNELICCDDLSLFDCTDYYYKVKNLINRDFILIPKSYILQNANLIKRTFEGDRIFIRPNSSDKSFTGTTITKKWFEKELDIIFSVNDYNARRKINDYELILFSSYKNIENEARAVVFDGKIVTCSTYIGNKELSDKDIELIDVSGCPGICTVDINIDTLEIIEVNSFSCAGLYNCDTDKIVKCFEESFKDDI